MVRQEAKLTSNGRITIPREVRRRLGVRAGDHVVFEEDEDGSVRLRPVPERLERKSRKQARKGSLHAIGDLIGSVDGLPSDLSTRKKKRLPARGNAKNAGESIPEGLKPQAADRLIREGMLAAKRGDFIEHEEVRKMITDPKKWFAAIDRLGGEALLKGGRKQPKAAGRASPHARRKRRVSDAED